MSDIQTALIKSLKRELAATRAELSSHIDGEERAKDSLQLSENECGRQRHIINKLIDLCKRHGVTPENIIAAQLSNPPRAAPELPQFATG